MANYGRHGVASTLVPFDPVPRKKSQETFEEQWLTELGLVKNGARSSLREESDAEFDRVAGPTADSLLTEEHFIAVAAQLWAFDRRAARACFHAADVDLSGRMSREEYCLFREAFVHQPPPEGAIHEAVLALQLRAIFHKYVITRPAQRSWSHDDAMTSDELFEFMRDLCAGDAHTRQVANDLIPLLIDEDGGGQDVAGEEDRVDISPTRGEITMSRFVRALSAEEFRRQLREHGLTSRDLTDCLRNPGKGHSYPMRFPRAVLDGRAETAILKDPWRSKLGLFSQASEHSRRQSSSYRAGVCSLEIQPEAVNAEMELDPHVRAVGGWRGPLAPARNRTEFEVASQVIERAMQLARELPAQTDVVDCNWLPRGAALRLLLGPNEAEQAKCIQTLAKGCQAQLAAQPSLVRVPAPAKVFGDVHGQLRDLLLMFGLFGTPTHCGGDIQTTNYVFNGDWVDRGEHQLEVVLVLFALKTIYPAQVFLVRGNHEFRGMSEGMEEDGFLHHMMWQMPKQWSSCYEALHEAFDWLPLGALVGGVVLVLHGGIGDGSWGLKDLEQVQRPLKWELEGCVLDALWSDPTDSDDWMYWGVHANEERGLGSGVAEFGPDVTAKFCRREGLSLVVRSHQYVRQGYKVMHGGHLITLFTARNYFGDVGQEANDGAILLLTPDINGHLRVHPKRLVKMELVGGSLRARLSRWMPCLAPCFYGLSLRGV